VPLPLASVSIHARVFTFSARQDALAKPAILEYAAGQAPLAHAIFFAHSPGLDERYTWFT
jgi:hypothetical protein